MKRICFIKLSFLVLCIGVGLAQAQTSVFTYQGKLTDMSAAANGQYDFTFRLFDDFVGGTQIGSGAACNGAMPGGADAVCDNVPVTNGIFTVNLNFGVDAFADGGLRFLEILVRPGASTGAFQPLTPRQQITSSPFSMKSLSATFADTLSSACVLCVTDGKIQSIDGSKITGTVANATTAANVSGIVPITNGGTGSSTKNFVDLSTNQTILGNKTFSQTTTLSIANVGSLYAGDAYFNGDVTFDNSDPVTVNGTLNVGGAVAAQQFIGSGENLTNVPGTFKWQTIAGLSQQAVRNTGYLANNDAQVTITLPTSIGIGETVRVSGIGAGGWKIAQNEGQSIIGTGINFATPIWTPHENIRNWQSVASSADGTKLVAVVQTGQIYTSIDSGENWIPRESNREWSSVASSADGTKLVATVLNGQIYTSTDSGANWTPRETSRAWLSVASSADGIKLVAVVGSGQIYTSTDSGANWIARSTNNTWVSVASSADGTKLVAATGVDRVHVSTNSGVNWQQITLPLPGTGGDWRSVASSADGKFAVAGGYRQIFTSVNSGSNWIPRGPHNYWNAIASSADGTRLVAVTDTDQIYISIDSGATWTGQESTRDWRSVASSADGTKLVAVARGGRIYTAYSSLTTTHGTAGFLTGKQYSSIELQYIGNGKFLPISSVGAITGF